MHYVHNVHMIIFFLRVGEGDEVVAVKFFGAFEECSREKRGVKIFYQRAIYSLF